MRSKIMKAAAWVVLYALAAISGLAIGAVTTALIFPGTANATVRSEAAKLAFVKLHACPATKLHKLPCKGWVIDHVKALDCGGLDAPSNMQWQTLAASKAKDKVERNGPGCKHRTNG